MAYALVRTGTAVNAAEVERADAEVLEAVLSWGDGADRNVLAVKHLAAGEPLVAGEGEELAIPEETLGAARMTLAAWKAGSLVVTAPPGAALRVNGWARTEREVVLAKGEVADLSIGKFALRVSAVAAPKAVPAAIDAKDKAGFAGSLFGSAAVHGLLLAAAAFLIAPLANAEADLDDGSRMNMMAASLDANAQREIEQREQKAEPEASDASGKTPLEGAGQVGKQDAPKTHGKFAYQGDKSRPTEFSREETMREAQTYGAIGTLDKLVLMHPTGMSAFTNGGDDSSARGDMFTGNIHDVFGTELQPGEDGNGPRGWVKMGDRVGPLGKCVSTPDHPCRGIAHGTDTGMPGHEPVKFSMRPGDQSFVGGGLPADVIQRTIHQRWGAFSFCYQQAVQNNPSLAGSVRVTFKIDRSGAVTFATDAGSDLPDATVRSCVAGTFRSMSFPAPKNGTVTVQYGFAFSPSNA